MTNVRLNDIIISADLTNVKLVSIITEVNTMADQVTKDTKIGELLRIDADVAPILLSIGMHCLGCPASQNETIEEAAAVHGVNADELVAALNEKINA